MARKVSAESGELKKSGCLDPEKYRAIGRKYSGSTQRNNTSGVNRVVQEGGAWSPRIFIQGTQIWLGMFSTKQKAERVLQAASQLKAEGIADRS